MAPLDLGLLAESMLFYQKVTVLADRGVVQQLVRQVGPDLLLELMNAGYLNVTYVRHGLGVLTNQGGTPLAKHRMSKFTVEDWDLESVAVDAFRTTTGKSRRGNPVRGDGRVG